MDTATAVAAASDAAITATRFLLDTRDLFTDAGSHERVTTV
jgi:hypothetical protein